MGELNIKKTLSCLICDTEVLINESYSIFYTFITNSGVLLANSLEKNLLLKDIGSLTLRSNLLCQKCFEHFEELTTCESKIIQLKGNLWSVYKKTCEKHGENAEAHIKAVSTQTDFSNFQCECIAKMNAKLNGSDENDCTHGGFSDLEVSHDSKKRLDGDIETIKVELEKSGEEITVEADPNLAENESLMQSNKKPETCKLRGKWFRKVSELDSHMAILHNEMNKEELAEDKKYDPRSRKKFHSCSICNKKFRRPCEVKEHMMSHKTTTPFICKYCGKKLKSKTGAIYHTLKTHKIDVGNNKNLEEHYHLDIIKSGETGIDVGYQEGAKQNDDVAYESSDDELPLARRRKEFIIEKIQKEIAIDKTEKSDRKKKTTQKEALDTLKNYCDVSITKVPNGLKSFPFQKQELMSEENPKRVKEDLNSERTENLPNKTKSEVSDSEESQEHEKARLNEKSKSRTRKYSVSSLTRVKRQREPNLFPPPMKEPKFKCDICGKMWKTRGELNAHKITHSDARPYICEICGQAYKHKPALDVHVGMHKGIYHHQCPYCQKAFTQKGALQRHLPIHTGDLPYQCELCGKRFVHRTSFSIHTMAHTGVRNIRCKICNLGVLSKSHLRRHMRIHTGEKPYDCQTCGKAFAERYNLVAHQRIHDPNLVGPARQQKRKVQSCRLCSATFDRRHKLEDHMVSIHNKVVEDSPRTSIFGSGDGYTAPRMTMERFDLRKPPERMDAADEGNKTLLSGDGCDSGNATASTIANSNDLSMRNLQNIHNSHLRNLELIRNLEGNRNFELIRMANGIGGVEESLRLGGSGTTIPWAYVNPGT